VYILPGLKWMDLVAALRAIATLHSFRFFGLVFILPGVVGPNLPAAGFATGGLILQKLLGYNFSVAV
jgi:hypothetical protein